MELGIYHEFPVLPGRSQAECFAAGFDIVDASEEYGLDSRNCISTNDAPSPPARRCLVPRSRPAPKGFISDWLIENNFLRAN